jgi:amino acid permease
MINFQKILRRNNSTIAVKSKPYQSPAAQRSNTIIIIGQHHCHFISFFTSALKSEGEETNNKLFSSYFSCRIIYILYYYYMLHNPNYQFDEDFILESGFRN